MPQSDPPSYRKLVRLGISRRVLISSRYLPQVWNRPSSSRPHRGPEGVKEFRYGVMKGERSRCAIIIAARTYSKNVPTFMQGSFVKGIVRLNLEKLDYIHSANVSVSIFPSTYRWFLLFCSIFPLGMADSRPIHHGCKSGPESHVPGRFTQTLASFRWAPTKHPRYRPLS
jgi:hypothetical protein